jgi:phage tail sheath gpL-like
MFTSGGFSGTAALNVAIPVGSAAQAANFFGLGSMLHRMCVAFFASNTSQQLWCLPIADPAGQAATGTLVFSVSNLQSGVLSLYIAGQNMQITVNSTDTATIVATNVAAAINALDPLPITATAAAGVVTMTCQWVGLTGNDIIVMPNYYGPQSGEVMPAGLTMLMSQITIPASAATTTASPTLTFTAGADINVVAGMTAYDLTVGTPSATSILGTVLSVANTTVTLNANAAHAVTLSDNIGFFSTAWGQLQGGTGNPGFSSAIANIQLLQFLYVGLPYNDAASLSAWAAEYGFGTGGRWNFQRQQYGMVLNCRRDTYSNLLTWGITQNAPVISTLGIEPKVPTPLWEVTACYAADAALGFTDDPARPLQTLELLGVLPALQQDRFLQTQRNNLANSGLAVQGVNSAGNMEILVEESQYQFNAFGQADTAFGKLTVLATLAELLTRMKSAITSKYPRSKLVPDGTRIGPGQAAVTPTDIKAEIVSEYRAAEFDGLVASTTDFIANLIVQIDPNSPNKVQVLWPPRLAGQLRQFDVLAQFRLMYPDDTQVAS